MKDIYIFEIQDNDHKEPDKNLMLYQNKNSLLIPLVKNFENGWSEFPSFENIIKFLKENKINNLTSYFPNDLDTICSHPYEIGDFTDYELENGACFHRFYHFEFSPSKNQINILKENNINIKYLNSKEISKLEQSLKYHQ
jgi:hypothetical protein